MFQMFASLVSLGTSLVGAAPNFDVKTVRYESLGIPVVAVYLVNNDVRTFDSLSVRVFVKSRDTVGTHTLQDAQGAPHTVPKVFSDDLATRYDICQLYDAAGFNNPCAGATATWSWASLNAMTQMIPPLPIGEPDAQGLRDWALDLPLGAMSLRSGEVVRFDVLLSRRSESSKVLSASQASLLDTLGGYLPDRQFPSQGDIGWWDVSSTGWTSFDARQSWTFQGTDSAASQGDVDRVLSQSSSTNTHLLIRRKGVDLWGSGPTGTGPGLFDPGPSPDEGRVLPYAPIAAPLPVHGERGSLDSALARPGRVRVNQAGYRAKDVAAGLARVRYYGIASSFQVQHEGGSVTAGGSFKILPFQDGTHLTVCEQIDQPPVFMTPTPKCRIDSDSLGTSVPVGALQEGTLPTTLAEGRWRVVVGSDTSSWFQVSDSVYGWVRDASIRYFGVARSGDSSWFHGPSHMLDGSLDGAPGANVGGWYDAGDHLKEPQTMATALVTLATLASTHPERDADRWGAVHRADRPLDGVPDVLKEARWGATFFLNSWIRNGRHTGADSSGHPGMVTGIGDFGSDHGYWGPPELQDNITAKGRGGANERTIRRELGGNTIADLAAALAMLSVDWRPWDAAWSNDALAASKDMYAYAKTHRAVVSSATYNGAGSDKTNANLALAATALLRATRDSTYLNDIAYDSLIGTHGAKWLTNGVLQVTPSSWEGGWMVMSNSNLTKGAANSDWANRHALALYAFARLILLDPDTARACGVRSEAERVKLLRHAVSGMEQNLSSISIGKSKAFDLPMLDPNASSLSVSAEDHWGTLYIQQDWVAPAYVAGDASELLMYADVVGALQAGKGGAELAAIPWPVEAAISLALRQIDWILGLNQWDISFLAGVGAKNMQDAHHRAANPDGRMTMISYDYRTPVGGLWGFSPSDSGKAKIAWNDYYHSETNIDGASQILSASFLLAPVASRSAAGIRGSLRASVGRFDALARRNMILARGSALGSGAPIRIELFDASGRRHAKVESEADDFGNFDLALPNVSRGLAILRVHASGSSRTISVVVP